MTTVELIDDQAIIRGASVVYSNPPILLLLGEAHAGGNGVPLVREAGPDVVLMDLRMPGVNRNEATR